MDVDIRKRIAHIGKQTDIKILVSLSCTMCPDLVIACQRIAAENPSVTAHVYDLRHFEELKMEGLVLLEGDSVLAVTMGSRLSEDTVDVHFEKADADYPGAYALINRAFARYIREKYPEVKFLNREEDMGLEGLRKAKLSYCPHHMVEKGWACLLEDGYDY